MAADAVLEELEVFIKHILRMAWDIELNAEPDDPLDGAEELKVTLCVHYTDEYPDALPDLSLKPLEGELSEEESESILDDLRSVVRPKASIFSPTVALIVFNLQGNENLGMAMTFTLVSHLRERLSHLGRLRAEQREKEEKEKERLVLEEEEARTRGTPVTAETFRVWKMSFDKEISLKRAREEDEKMKGLSSKEREEFKRVVSRLSGRQLFERGDRNLEDETLLEDGTVSVDASQYEREDFEEEEEEGVTFSDSD
ncbi:hypothetical protein H0H93_016077 [Arthromyces matolae]|nr:hypothetical protein H0H93_016077 [Arthromyces matolae]